ncbi:MAG: hypothetical protein R3D30_13875 [Hyphomicrobiales bacterium]
MADDLATTNEDNITQSAGADTLTITDNLQLQVNDFFDGGDGHDVIVINDPLFIVDLTSARIGDDVFQWDWGATNGFHNYEGISFGPTGGGVSLDTTFFGAGFLSNALAVTGAAGESQYVQVVNGHSLGGITFSAENWTFTNWDADDFVILTSAYNDNVDETFIGSTGSDELWGYGGNDTLSGGSGADRLVGGLGRDTMTGGADSDTFDFDSKNESKKGAANRDIITDFSGIGGDGDVIDLSGIDAKKGSGNQAFKFIGTKKFHEKKGELHYKYDAAHDVTVISGDIKGNGKADFEIALTGQHNLTPDDFVL